MRAAFSDKLSDRAMERSLRLVERIFRGGQVRAGRAMALTIDAAPLKFFLRVRQTAFPRKLTIGAVADTTVTGDLPEQLPKLTHVSVRTA